MTNKPLIIAVIVLTTLTVCAYSIAEVVVGFREAENTECDPDGGPMNLAKWLFIDGVVGLVFWGVVGISATFGACIALKGGSAEGAVVGIIPIILASLLKGAYNLAWFVVGCVVLARVEDSCAEEVNNVYVFGILTLVLQALAICFSCGTSRLKSSSD